MSTRRHKPGAYGDTPLGPNGKPTCRQCGEEVSGRRRTFCSDECVAIWRNERDQKWQREQVFARDDGRCQLCGLDVSAFERRVHRFRHRCMGGDSVARMRGLRSWRRYARVLKASGFSVPDYPYQGLRSLWEMDHIKPVVLGGGECGLDNLRVLCVPCHRGVTRELRAELARLRRAEETA